MPQRRNANPDTVEALDPVAVLELPTVEVVPTGEEIVNRMEQLEDAAYPDGSQPVVEIPVNAPEAEAEEDPFGVYNAQSAQRKGHRFLIYGASGTGKTWLGSTFPKPVFMDIENGMSSVAHRSPLRYPRNPNRIVEELGQVEEFYQLCRTELRKREPRFRTIVFDSLNAFKELLERHTLKTFDVERPYADQLTLNDYGKIKRDFTFWFNAFRRLPCNVVFISHMDAKRYEEDQATTNLGSVTALVQRYVDAVGYCYTVVNSQTGEIQYMVSFSNTPDHIGKDRIGIGPRPVRNTYQALFPTRS